ncbi:MAG: AAA family ATPase [Firmicutes bacterium]|nr:AAA family ATPase [Bacillota bacterium]
MPELKVSLLQIPRIWVDGKEMSFPLRKADALFYYMICTKTATREELISLLWEQCDPETGRKNLRNALYVIKKSLGVEVLVARQKDRLFLNPELNIECDYQKLMEQDDYLAFHGLFLNGFSIKDANAFDEWIRRIREQVRQQYLSCLSRLASSTNQLGAVGRAERCALEYLRENPADEEMTCFLMGLYQKQSKYAKAIHVYQKLRDYLAQEMGISPVVATKQLYYEILKEWNIAASNEASPPGRQYLPPSQRPVYRELLQRYIRFHRGLDSGGMILLQGPAGVGKTFLLARMADSLDSDLPLAQARCFPPESKRPYAIWQGLLAAIKSAFPDLQGEGRMLIDRLNACHLVAQNEDYEQDLLRLLSLIVCQQRIVLLIEDIQWIDPCSLQLLDKIGRAFFHMPLLILLSGRDRLPAFVMDAVTLGLSDRLLHVISLSYLSSQETYDWLRLCFNAKIAKAAVDAVYQATRGCAFLLKRLCDSAYGAADPLPALLNGTAGLFREHMNALSLPCRRLLQFVSYFPKGAPLAALAPALGFTEQQVNELLEELAASFFPVGTTGAGDDVLLTIRDENLRLKCYWQDSVDKRLETHRNIAGILESLPRTEANLRLISYHYMLGNSPADALNSRGLLYALYLKRLCGQGEAYLQQVLTEELPELDRCLAAAEQIAPDIRSEGQQWIVLMDIVAALFSNRQKDIPDKLTRVFAESVSSDPSLPPLAIRLISHYAWQKKEAQELYDQLTAQAGDSDSYPPFYLMLLAELLSLGGRYVDCEKLLRPLLREAGPLQRACAGHGLGLNAQRQGRSCAVKRFAYAARQADSLPPFYGIARIYLDAGRAAQDIDEGQLARKMLHSAQYLAVKTNDSESLAVSRAYLSISYGAEGQRALAGFFLKQAVQSASAQSLSALAQGAICFARARLSSMVGLEQDSGADFDDLLTEPAPLYCRRGLLTLSTVQDAAPEIRGLRKCLE